MSNFSYIPTKWDTFRQTLEEAERNVFHAPMYTAMLCRKSLEEWVRWLYAHDQDLVIPNDDSLNTLIHEPCFKALVNTQFNQINLVRKIGNNAVHKSTRIPSSEALHSLKIMHGFIGWIVMMYSEEKIKVPSFDEDIIPKVLFKGPKVNRDKSKDELQQTELRFHESLKKIQKLEAELEQYKELKEKNKEYIPPVVDPNEQLTRQLYIDALLREAGWDPNAKGVVEYPLPDCMPLENGGTTTGYADYVLWGKDGKPLAVVEAKRTKRDPKVGQHQAKLYANCLEQLFDQRPLIFYSNGYDTWFWDDLKYPPRKVNGFYTLDELQLLVNRRGSSKKLSKELISDKIVDRPYQHEAIRAFCETLERHQREGLLVMATGTGKTRVAAAIIDLLSKAGWVKRVLFLADRNALVTQAKNSMNDYLPHLPSVDLTKEKEDESSRIVFSTYQTIINMIDGESDNTNRFYGIGHFDLIIFDEIHRSVYNKYKAIFSYFDGIRLGLTATPKSEADRDTYELFGLQPNAPTFAYELNQGVEDKYLVPPVAISVPLKFHREGIRYEELSNDEKLKYEEVFANPITGEFPDEIDAGALNTWLFNTDTVDKIIGHLMENGIKVEGGDKLGKTILFARSHAHAKFIEERFNIQYPEYKGEFLRVIDYHEEYKHDLLYQFKSKHKLPQIAVSVDMLDTGIDVPEVVNLVFLKRVQSSAKYWQMIGRGTRLCKDLFGQEMDKEQFVIFDFCENFEFFSHNPRGIESAKAKSVSQRLFELRLRLWHLLNEQSDEGLKELGKQVLSFMVNQVRALNTNSFIVRQHLKVVEKYQDANAWNALSDLEQKELLDHIAPIVTEISEKEAVKRFDALMFEIEIKELEGDPSGLSLKERVTSIAEKLTKKLSIPAVAARINTINEVRTPDYWANVNIVSIEHLRTELRKIVQFLDKDAGRVLYTSFTDEIGEVRAVHDIVFIPNDLEAYRRKVEQFINQHQDDLVIIKLRNNIAINPHDLDELEHLLFKQGEIGTKNDFVKAYGEQGLGKFIRSILGLEVSAAKQAFAGILENQTLNSRQIRFIDTLINYISTKGIIDPSVLFDVPFVDINDTGISGLFDDATTNKILEAIEVINENAG